MITAHDRDILIRTILGEAANQGPEGQAAVAHVILNRAADPRWPNGVANVALQGNGKYHQFSAWNSKSRTGNDLVRRYGPGSKRYEAVARVVDDVLSGKVPDPTGGATHYYAPSGMPGGKAPRWWGQVTKEGAARRIGAHRFAGKGRGNTGAFIGTGQSVGGSAPNAPSSVGTGEGAGGGVGNKRGFGAGAGGVPEWMVQRASATRAPDYSGLPAPDLVDPAIARNYPAQGNATAFGGRFGRDLANLQRRASEFVPDVRRRISEIAPDPGPPTPPKPLTMPNEPGGPVPAMKPTSRAVGTFPGVNTVVGAGDMIRSLYEAATASPGDVSGGGGNDEMMGGAGGDDLRTRTANVSGGNPFGKPGYQAPPEPDPAFPTGGPDPFSPPGPRTVDLFNTVDDDVNSADFMPRQDLHQGQGGGPSRFDFNPQQPKVIDVPPPNVRPAAPMAGGAGPRQMYVNQFFDPSIGKETTGSNIRGGWTTYLTPYPQMRQNIMAALLGGGM